MSQCEAWLAYRDNQCSKDSTHIQGVILDCECPNESTLRFCEEHAIMFTNETDFMCPYCWRYVKLTEPVRLKVATL